jgi:tRNA 2-thiouridine synthesizing protein A
VTDDEIEVDARGLYCPLPVLRLARALRREPAGRVARLLATDPVSVQDVQVYCREQKATLLDSRRDGDMFAFRVRKG